MVSIDEDFACARTEMECLLQNLELEFKEGRIVGVKVPFDHPRLIARGTNSLIFWLTERRMAGKTFLYREVSPGEDTQGKGYFMSVAEHSGLMEYGLEQTIGSLNKMGFTPESKIILPRMEQYITKPMMFAPYWAKFTIMRELREGDRFQLADADGFEFGSLLDGKKLEADYETACRNILDACSTKGEYHITCAGHGSEEIPDEAVRHMFFVRHNAGEAGLVIGDLDHLIIKPK